MGTAGIRTATMYLTAEQIGKRTPENITRVLSCAIVYSLCVSCAVSLGLFCFAPQLAGNWIGNIKTVDSLRMVAVFLPVNCLCGVMIGYFTGANRITTLASVEVAEQLCTILMTMQFLQLWGKNSAENACRAVILGAALGNCITLVCLTVLRILQRPAKNGKVPVNRRLLGVAVPLALADDLRTGISTAENLMVPKRLSLYPGGTSPLAQFGMVSGMVFPILMFPAAILFGLTELLVPELAQCNAAGNRRRIHHLVRKSLRIALLYGCMCAGILYLSADELCRVLYHSQQAGGLLKWYAPLAVMLYCDAVTDAMLKGLGQQKASVRYNILTSSMDVAMLFLLLPMYGIKGYFFSFVISHGINFFLSIRCLLLITQEQIDVFAPILAIISSVLSCWGAGFVTSPISREVVYLLLLGCLLYLTSVIRKEDLIWTIGLIKNHPGKNPG